MSDDSGRKYRQRGYQDDTRDRTAKRGAPAKEQTARAPGRQLQDAAGPRTPNLMGSREVFRCARCGNLLSLEVANDGRCTRCGVDLDSGVQVASLDTSARLVCWQAGLTARIPPTDERNGCSLERVRTT